MIDGPYGVLRGDPKGVGVGGLRLRRANPPVHVSGVAAFGERLLKALFQLGGQCDAIERAAFSAFWPEMAFR